MIIIPIESIFAAVFWRTNLNYEGNIVNSAVTELNLIYGKWEDLINRWKQDRKDPSDGNISEDFDTDYDIEAINFYKEYLKTDKKQNIEEAIDASTSPGKEVNLF